MEIKIDDTVVDIITVDELIDLENRKLEPLKRILGHFAYADGEKLTPEQGALAVGGLSINEIRVASLKLQERLQANSVPK